MDTTRAAATIGTGTGSMEPGVWSDLSDTYTSPSSQRSEEWMRERADELKGRVRQMFVGGTADMLSLVDTLEHLSIDKHFHEEISVALSRIHSSSEEHGDGSEDLCVVALKFYLLRQHGFWVPTDVFNKFRDDKGNFSKELTTNPKGVLSFYNAAHMAVLGEEALDEIAAFARRHLELAKPKLSSPMAEQVSRALEIPRPRSVQRLEAMHYVTEYEKEERHNTTILELAKLDFNILRSLHLKELKEISLWWRDLYNDVKLTYARNRIVETYLYTCGVFHEEENSHARLMLAKGFALLSLLDDTYDTYATFEECNILTEAIQRWDESCVPILPEYLHMFYIKQLRNLNEFEDSLEPWEKYRMTYIKEMSKKYLKEAEWFSKTYTPRLKEHVDVSLMSTGLPMLSLVALMGAGKLTTKEAFDWAIHTPDIVRGCAEIGRFLNDISSYFKPRTSKKDAASSFECYMKEDSLTPSDAVAAFATMVEHAWRINQERMELDHGILPAAQLVVNMTRINEVLYLHGRDAYTSGNILREAAASLFQKEFRI